MTHKNDRTVQDGEDHSLIMLKRIYDIHENIIKKASWACKERCSTCCTRNVALTTLEGRYILEALPPEKRKPIFDQLTPLQSGKRYQPKLTTNGFAEACVNNLDTPEEENDPSWGVCPILKNSRCPIYERRPMGCRIMVSEVQCHDSSGALMAEKFIIIGQLFLQYVEHLDQNGHYGNLIDILLLLESRMGKNSGRQQDQLSPVLKNSPASYLLIPPEYQAEIWPLLMDLKKIVDS